MSGLEGWRGGFGGGGGGYSQGRGPIAPFSRSPYPQRFLNSGFADLQAGGGGGQGEGGTRDRTVRKRVRSRTKPAARQPAQAMPTRHRSGTHPAPLRAQCTHSAGHTQYQCRCTLRQISQGPWARCCPPVTNTRSSGLSCCSIPHVRYKNKGRVNWDAAPGRYRGSKRSSNGYTHPNGSLTSSEKRALDHSGHRFQVLPLSQPPPPPPPGQGCIRSGGGGGV